MEGTTAITRVELSATVTLTVQKAATTTTLSSDAKSTFTDNVNLSATIHPLTPQYFGQLLDGQVTFTDASNGTVLGTITGIESLVELVLRASLRQRHAVHPGFTTGVGEQQHRCHLQWRYEAFVSLGRFGPCSCQLHGGMRGMARARH